MSRTRRQEPLHAWEQKLLRRGLALTKCIHDRIGGCPEPNCDLQDVVPLTEEIRQRLEPTRGTWHLPRDVKRSYWKRVRLRERLARVALLQGAEEALWPSKPRHELRVQHL